MLFRQSQLLLNVSPATDEGVVGQAYSINLQDQDASFRGFMSATQSGGDTSPTVSVFLETSVDNVKWVEVGNLKLTADGTVTDLKKIDALGPLVRARTVVAGGAKPTHQASVHLVSTGGFTLIKAP